MVFELKVDFAGLIAFVANAKDVQRATLWNAVLVDPTMKGHMADMEKHYPMLSFPGDCLLDSSLPDELSPYRSLPPLNGIPMIGLPIDGMKISFSPVQDGIKSHMDAVASLDLASSGAGLVAAGVFDTLDVCGSVGASMDIRAGELYGSQSDMMQGRQFAFTNENGITTQDYTPMLCDQVRLVEFRDADGVTVKFEFLKYDGAAQDGYSVEIHLQPIGGSLPLILSNLPYEAELDLSYHREHFKHYYDLSYAPLDDKDRPMPTEVKTTGGQTGKLVFCISGVVYSE